MKREKIKLRQKKLKNLLAKRKIESFLVSDLINIRYLTGFNCSFGYVYYAGGELYFFSDSRYTAEARAKSAAGHVIQVKANDVFDEICGTAKHHGASTIMFEKANLRFEEYEALKRSAKGIDLTPGGGLVQELRIIKDSEELESIRKASRIMDAAFKSITGAMKKGMTERDLQEILEIEMLKQKSEGVAFETIVASGPRGAFAHGKPSDRKLKDGDFVVLDFGARFNGYNSDMTRTIHVGECDSESRKKYNAVLEAQEKALEACVVGSRASNADRVARDVLRGYGLEKYFTHGLGHGVGLEVHESPRLAHVSDDKFKSGMVFTVEPGIYIEGWGGIRIEDTVVLTHDGPERLTKTPKKLICI